MDIDQTGSFYVAIETYRRKSIGTLIRCAAAFGAKAIIVVGSLKYSTHGAHGAQKHLPIIHFFYWSECKKYAYENGYAVVGISSSHFYPDIQNLSTYQIPNSVIFVVGSRGPLLTLEQRDICDVIVEVTFPISDRLAQKINYDVIVSLCFNHFALKCKFSQISLQGEKYTIQNSQVKSLQTPSSAASVEEVKFTPVEYDDCLSPMHTLFEDIT